jgi:hypothetical protein
MSGEVNYGITAIEVSGLDRIQRTFNPARFTRERDTRFRIRPTALGNNLDACLMCRIDEVASDKSRPAS